MFLDKEGRHVKRVLIGGFLSLVGTIWSLAVILFAGNHLVSSWGTPPGRFLTTVMDTGMLMPLILACLIFVSGLLILCVEYFKKDKYMVGRQTDIDGSKA